MSLCERRFHAWAPYPSYYPSAPVWSEWAVRHRSFFPFPPLTVQVVVVVGFQRQQVLRLEQGSSKKKKKGEDFLFLFFFLGKGCTSSVPWGTVEEHKASMGVSSVYGGCRQNGRVGSEPLGGKALSSILFSLSQGLEYFRAHSRDKRIPCLLSGQGY